MSEQVRKEIAQLEAIQKKLEPKKKAMRASTRRDR